MRQINNEIIIINRIINKIQEHMVEEEVKTIKEEIINKEVIMKMKIILMEGI